MEVFHGLAIVKGDAQGTDVAGFLNDFKHRCGQRGIRIALRLRPGRQLAEHAAAGPGLHGSRFGGRSGSCRSGFRSRCCGNWRGLHWSLSGSGRGFFLLFYRGFLGGCSGLACGFLRCHVSAPLYSALTASSTMARISRHTGQLLMHRPQPLQEKAPQFSG